MTGGKCSQCGFVSSRSNERCKRCGASFKQSGDEPRKRAGRVATKTVLIVVIGAIVALGMGVWLVSAAASSPAPAPNEVSRLLYADAELNHPLTLEFPTQFTRKYWTPDQQEDFVLEDYLEAQVLDRLGLITVTFDKVKEPNRHCWHYRLEELPPSPFSTGERFREVEDPNGPHERCEDVWDYSTKIEFVDPDTVEAAAMSDKVQTLTDIPEPAPPRNRPSAFRGAPVSLTTVPIGSIEIVEVSDAVAAQRSGTYTVGFKFRIKPNGLGALVDLNNPVHKSLPPGIRQLFRYKVLEGTEAIDKRLTYIFNASGADGLTLGHADLVREGIFNPHWKVAHVYLDLIDKTKYTYHQVD